ncbi:MAG: hypothetical protein KJ799_02635 [Bacteroidetes bacterium]|nr:hypothetical protein [Bacteroidota bacterium]MBU1681115.1 hypothetical protein [Bacteroidota bacterium]MBU2505609.1 hypothetical protein [Bacteroidota bacterium]
MVTLIKKGMRKKEIYSLLEHHKKLNRKKIDLEKYCGIIELKEDPIITQKKLRNEWK